QPRTPEPGGGPEGRIPQRRPAGAGLRPPRPRPPPTGGGQEERPGPPRPPPKKRGGSHEKTPPPGGGGRAPARAPHPAAAKVEEVNKRWEADQEKPFCKVGDPQRLRLLVPISTEDIDLIRADLNRQKKVKKTLEVTVRIQGRGTQTWEGEITHVPESEAKE